MRFASTVRSLAIGATAATLLAATAAPTPQHASATPSDPAILSSLIGKPATGLTFAPLDGSPAPLVTPGRPTVVIAFASWCVACIQEMPRTIADYAKYHDRVAFRGIDYTESPAVAKKMVARYAIPFPVESYASAAATTASASPETLTISSTMTRDQVLGLKTAFPDEFYRRIVAVYDARSTMTPSDFAAYERRMRVYFKDPKDIAAETAAAKQKSATLDLPHSFVIDANGIVTNALEGYTPSVDRLALALLKLGIK